MKYIVKGIMMLPGYTESELVDKIATMIGVDPDFFTYKVVRKSLDARKCDLYYVLNAIVETHLYIKRRNVSFYNEPQDLSIPKAKLPYRPVIIGFGPAGMFAALILSRSGAKPIIIERGKKVEERRKDVERLKSEGVLNPNSNVCYGEGGAGTFSDGKLHTGVNDEKTKFVLTEFVRHGAKEDILVDGAPHIGSDYLQRIVKNFREEIVSNGGDILFESEFVGLVMAKGKVTGIRYVNEGTEHSIDTDKVILALGHSPYDTVSTLLDQGLMVEPKDYSIGVRIENTQKAINEDRYRSHANDPSLPQASYKCVAHLKDNRTAYSFCMCPGGEVVNSSTEMDEITTNGMSNNNHGQANGNCALLVNVRKGDYYHGNPLDGFAFRREIEKAAYDPSKPFYAPIQLIDGFLKNEETTKLGRVLPSYRPGTYFSNLSKSLPVFISESLKEGIMIWRKHLSFMNEPGALLVGFETRSSSPVRIPRGPSFEANIKGLYPCGEGASYAGGITSAALDGINVAMAILKDN